MRLGPILAALAPPRVRLSYQRAGLPDRPCRPHRYGVSEPEHNSQCGVYFDHLGLTQMPDQRTQPLWIDSRGLLGQHPGPPPVDLDLGPEARVPG